MVNWYLPAPELIFEAFFWLTFIAYKPSQILPKTFQKPSENSIFFAIRSYHFFVLILHRWFANFLLISRPSKPEKSCSRAGGSTIFTKSTFSLRIQKPIKKTSKFGFKNQWKLEKNRLKKESANMLAFNIDFSWFSLHFASQVASKISDFFRLFFVFFEFFCKIGLRWPQEPPKSAPRAPRSAPRAAKSAPRAPKSVPRAAKIDPRMPKSAPRAPKIAPRAQKQPKTR